MQISIIICTRNRALHLKETLESLNSIALPSGVRVELLVVDNGSTDETAQVVRQWRQPQIPLRHVVEARAGLSNARNSGIRESSGDILVFTDDDLRFPKGWLEGMCLPIAAGKADAVAGQVKLAPHLERDWMKLSHRSWLASSERLARENELGMVGANMSFSRNLLDVVPSFDIELGAGALGCGEETLFSQQILKRGKRICLSQADAVIHHFEESRLLRASWHRAAANMGRSQAYVKHHWEHGTIPNVRYWLCRALIGYYIRRMLRWKQCSTKEGMPEWEMWSLAGIYLYRQYIIESQRPRNYELHGTVKLSHSSAAVKMAPSSALQNISERI